MSRPRGTTNRRRPGSMGELICQRTLEKTDDGYVPGQHQARILDPGEQRDRGDMGAALTYVDDEGRACMVLCLRYRDEGWRAYMLHRSGLRKAERSTIAGVPQLEGELLATLKRAAEGVEPYPYRAPSESEQRTRRAANALWDKVTNDTATREGADGA